MLESFPWTGARTSTRTCVCGTATHVPTTTATRSLSKRETTLRRGVSGGRARTCRSWNALPRVSADTIAYEVTFEDPTTWTSPWTLMIPLKQSEGDIFEYACHEGNYGLEGILSGTRAQERAAQAAESR